MSAPSLKQLDSIIQRCDTATSTELADEMIQRTGRRISPRTIRRVRTHALGRHPLHGHVVQSLSQGNKTRRLNFARLHAGFDFRTWLFSDEKLWYIARTGHVHWIQTGDPIPTKEVADIRDTLMVWGCVWWAGKTTHAKQSTAITTSTYSPLICFLKCLHVVGTSFSRTMPHHTQARKRKIFLLSKQCIW